MKSDAKKYAVPALDKAFDVLEYLTGQALPKSQTEIAQGIGRGANEIYRMLVALESRGYLVRDELSGRYSLSFKLYNLSRSISPIDQIRQCALPHMEDLAVKIGQSCHLSMLYQSQAMVIVQARSHTPISVNITEGSTFPVLQSNAGYILLANSNNDVRDMILDRDDTYRTMPSLAREGLLDLLATIRTDGYYVSPNENADGICDYSALIGRPAGKIVAALTISAITKNNDHESELVTKLKETTLRISTQLGLIEE